MSLQNLSWVFYIVGFALVVGGYLGIVSNSISWIGWCIGMVGWGMQFLPNFRDKSPARQIAEYAELRNQGLISEEEFEKKKASLLDSGIQ